MLHPVSLHLCLEGNQQSLLPLSQYLCVCAQLLSRVQIFAPQWTVAHQVPLPMEFSREEYWNGLHFLFHGIFPVQGSIMHLLHWQLDFLPLRHLGIYTESPPWASVLPPPSHLSRLSQSTVLSSLSYIAATLTKQKYILKNAFKEDICVVTFMYI